jgi:hypothetical protein
MARSGRQVPNVYFGRPGSLVTLPWPRGDQDSPYDRLTYDFVTGAGQHAVSSMVYGSRSFTVNWEALHVDNYALIEQYRIGVNGAGPWAYIDPSRPNLLMPNQSAAGGLTNDASQWKTLTGAANEGQLSANSDPTFIHRTRGTRSLRWLFNVSAATVPVLLFTTPYRNWPGIPAVADLPYSFASWMRADGIVDSSITAGIRLRWLTAAGAEISETSSGNLTVTGTWQRITATGTAPANTAYVEPRYVATGSSITTGASLYIDEPLLEQDSVVNDWAPGTGVRPVEIVGLPETVPFDVRMRTGLSLELRELAV